MTEPIPPQPSINTRAETQADHRIAFARLYGEPLFYLPDDLYIPPDALEIFLETFEGPLDLLLHLIRKQNFNILDIPMFNVTQQYLSYIEKIRSHSLELAADYLLMAATLIEIKSRMLLPAKKSAQSDEADDPRAELVKRLLEYEKIKLAAQKLGKLPQENRDFLVGRGHVEHVTTAALPEITAKDIQDAWHDILERAKLVKNHHITSESLNIREYMGIVLRLLQNKQYLDFSHLIGKSQDRKVFIVTFIAVLELTKERLLEVIQAEAFSPIYVRLNYTPHFNESSLTHDDA